MLLLRCYDALFQRLLPALFSLWPQRSNLWRYLCELRERVIKLMRLFEGLFKLKHSSQICFFEHTPIISAVVPMGVGTTSRFGAHTRLSIRGGCCVCPVSPPYLHLGIPGRYLLCRTCLHIIYLPSFLPMASVGGLRGRRGSKDDIQAYEARS